MQNVKLGKLYAQSKNRVHLKNAKYNLLKLNKKATIEINT